jgi:hypothetical protein
MTGAYGGQWDRLRRSLLAAMRDGDPCPRCGRPMFRTQALDVGHVVDVVAGGALADGARLEHGRCNRQAGGRVGRARQLRRAAARRRRRMRPMLAEIAIGLEISHPDRDHTSVALAGYDGGGGMVVERVSYLDGPDAGVGAVLALRKERKVIAVAVDPRSQGATLVRPLEAAYVEVTKLGTADVAAAHGQFMDLLKAGGLKIASSPELDRAARRADTRRLAGATAWMRGEDVDMSPLTAATWAVWAVLHAPRYPPAEIF